MKPQSSGYLLLGMLGLCVSTAACLQSTTYSNADVGGSYIVLSPENIPADAATVSEVRVVVRRGDGTALPGLRVGLQVDNGSITQPQSVTDGNGVTIASLTAMVPGEHTVSARLLLEGGGIGLEANTLINAYTSAVAGTAVVPAGTMLNLIVVGGFADAGYRGTVHFAATDSDATLPADYTYTAEDVGVHMFRGLVLATAGNQTITVTDTGTGQTLRSATFEIVQPDAAGTAPAALPPTSLAMSAPLQSTAGLANRVLVYAMDARGNASSSFVGTLHWTSTDANAQLPADLSLGPDDRGQYTFTNLVLVTAGAQNITVSATGLASATQQISVLPGLPRYLAFATPPVTTAACSPITPGVQVQEYDAYGNPTSDFGDTVALTLQGGAGTAVLQGNTQVRTIGGVATFSNLAVSVAGGNYVLAASIGYDSTPSVPFTVGPDTPIVVSVGPVSPGSGDIAVPYVMSDGCGTQVNLAVSFDVAMSGNFVRATAAPSDANYQGVTRVATSLAGVAGTFLWNSLQDIGPVNANAVRVSITATAGTTASVPGISTPFAVSNGPDLAPHTDLSASVAQTCVVLADINHDARLDMLACGTDANTLSTYMGDGNGNMASGQNLVVTAPVAVAAGQLNGDANMDVVIAQNNNSVAVALGQGFGELAVTSSVSLSASPSAVALGDLNKDGKTDIVTANLDGSLCVALGIGDGTFAAPRAVAAGTRLTALALTDLNRDGNLDVLSTDGAGQRWSIVWGDGSGNLSPPAVVTNLHAGETPQALTVADLDHNGAPDVILALAGSPNLAVYINDHAGGFSSAVLYAVGAQPESLAVADFDGNGSIDVSVASAAAGVQIFPGDGNGSFKNPSSFATGSNPVQLAVGDINRDGEPDIVTANSTGLSLSLLNNARRAPHNARWGMPVISKFQIAGNYATGSLGVGDINGDGKADAALTLPNQPGMGIMLGDGAGNLSQGYVVNIETPDPTGLYLTDLNRDGAMDLITPSDASNVLILSYGPTTFASDQTARFASTELLGVEGSPANAIANDLNGDGWPDILVANTSSNTFSVLISNNGTSFQPEVGVPCGAAPLWIELADVDSNGALDAVVAQSTDNTVGVYLNDGLGNFSPGVTLATGANPHHLAVDDLDGDGFTDLAVASAVNTVNLFAGLGNGNFTTKTSVSCRANPVAVASVHAGAGFPHLAVVSSASPWQLSLYPNNGNFLYGAPTNTVTDYSPGYIATGDLNSDGYADILTSSTANTATSVLTDGDGNFLLTSPSGGSADFYNGAVSARTALADLNHDGHPDVVELNVAAVGVKMGLDNAAFTPFASVYTVASSGSPRSLWSADINRDGWMDSLATMAAGTYVSLNDGNGSLQAPTAYGPTGQTNSAPLDFNLDGNLDVLTGTPSGLQLLLGNGTGALTASGSWATAYAPTELSLGDYNQDGAVDVIATLNGALQLYVRSGNNFVAQGATLTTNCTLGRSAVADVNRDGNLDVLSNCTNGTGQIAVYLGDGTGNFGAGVTYAAPGDPESHLQVMDLTLDAIPDVLLPLSTGRGVGLWVGNGDGTFQNVRYLGVDVSPTDTSVADFNFDGQPDMFVVGQDYSIAFGIP